MSAAPEWSNLLGGHDDNGEYEHDPDFEFDAPQWVDIASDGQDVARPDFDAWFQQDHTSHEGSKRPGPPVPLITPPRTKYFTPHTERAVAITSTSAPSHVTPAVVATASRLHAGLPARTATSTSNPRHAPHARAARKSLHPEHAGHHAHARPRVSPGLPAAAEEPLPAVDSTDEDEGDLALVLAHHNCKIGAPQGDDELVLALAQHNSRVRHREQSPEASKQGQQDDEDVAKALAEHNNRVRQRAASPQQQATLPPVDGQDTDEERALDQHQPPSPPSGKLHDRQAGNNTAAAAGACAGMLDEDELVAMLAAHNARVGIQRLARIAPAPASGRVEEETLPPPASAAPRSIRPLAHVTHTARSHKPVATAGGQLQSTLDAQLALKVNRHTTKTQQKQHRPPKHAIWRGSDAHESAARLEGKAAASRRPVLQDKSNRATATGNLKQREKAKQDEDLEDIKGLLALHNQRVRAPKL